jgi:hypothetical protein
MTTKPKTRKALAASLIFDTATVNMAIEQKEKLGCDKLREAHREMWKAINFLTLIKLAAREAVDDRDNAEDYAHAIGTAASNAAERIQSAYDMIDEFGRQMTQLHAGKGIVA